MHNKLSSWLFFQLLHVYFCSSHRLQAVRRPIVPPPPPEACPGCSMQGDDGVLATSCLFLLHKSGGERLRGAWCEAPSQRVVFPQSCLSIKSCSLCQAVLWRRRLAVLPSSILCHNKAKHTLPQHLSLFLSPTAHLNVTLLRLWWRCTTQSSSSPRLGRGGWKDEDAGRRMSVTGFTLSLLTFTDPPPLHSSQLDDSPSKL